MSHKLPPKEDWFAFVEQEEAEGLACGIVEEVLQKTQEVIFEKHIERQVLPFAVLYAKDSLVTMVEWHFFRRDPGDILPEACLPDKEPEPAMIDSWARGAIPTKRPASPPKDNPTRIINIASTSFLSFDVSRNNSELLMNENQAPEKISRIKSTVSDKTSLNKSPTRPSKPLLATNRKDNKSPTLKKIRHNNDRRSPSPSKLGAIKNQDIPASVFPKIPPINASAKAVSEVEHLLPKGSVIVGVKQRDLASQYDKLPEIDRSKDRKVQRTLAV